MSAPTSRSYGRAALIGVLLGLLLVITAGVYVHIGRLEASGSLAADAGDPEAEARRIARLTVLLAVLLISALLLLLFVVGSYLVIRIGRMLQTPVGGPPTTYVDAWQSYRVTPEQIAAATEEDEPGAGGSRGPRPSDESPPSNQPHKD